jgi:hypothetical protein
MKPADKTSFVKLAALLAASILVLACIIPLSAGKPATPAVGSQPTAPAGKPTAAPQQPPAAETTPVGGAAAPQGDPLDHLLGLRSIKFNLNTSYPDGGSQSLEGEIDSTGNMHLKFSLPGAHPGELPEGIDPNKLLSAYEVYVVGGTAYQPNELEPAWSTQPVDDAYLETLAGDLQGPGGPAFWLDILPEGSIQEAGKETVGGFACDRYQVNGKLGGQTITGTLWEEPQADALVQAELHVPAALLSPPDKPQSGEVKITFKAEKADVPSVKLPAAPAAGAVQPTTTP